MNHTNIATVLLMLAMIMILLSLSGCGARTIQNCDFNPGVTIESKNPPKDKDGKSDDADVLKELPVKVSPKGEVTCTF